MVLLKVLDIVVTLEAACLIVLVVAAVPYMLRSMLSWILNYDETRGDKGWVWFFTVLIILVLLVLSLVLRWELSGSSTVSPTKQVNRPRNY